MRIGILAEFGKRDEVELRLRGVACLAPSARSPRRGAVAVGLLSQHRLIFGQSIGRLSSFEQDIRQECRGFDQQKVETGVQQFLQAYPHNRLVAHLANNCALTYQCPAARNYFMGRWECPIPSSPACNANCVGCISFQPEDEAIVSTQDRLTFKPRVEEIVEYSVPHLETAPYPIVSFGQGCEGEPRGPREEGGREAHGDLRQQRTCRRGRFENRERLRERHARGAVALGRRTWEEADPGEGREGLGPKPASSCSRT